MISTIEKTDSQNFCRRYKSPLFIHNAPEGVPKITQRVHARTNITLFARTLTWRAQGFTATAQEYLSHNWRAARAGLQVKRANVLQRAVARALAEVLAHTPMGISLRAPRTCRGVCMADSEA